MLFGDMDQFTKPQWQRVLNVETDDIPAFACVRVVDVNYDEEEQLIFEVEKAYSIKKKVLHFFNGPQPIEADELGQIQSSYPAIAKYEEDDGVPVNGETWGPGVGDSTLRKGNGGFIVVGVVDSTEFLVSVVRDTTADDEESEDPDTGEETIGCSKYQCISPALELAADEPCTCGAKVIQIDLPAITGTDLENVGGIRFLVYDSVNSNNVNQFWKSSTMTRDGRDFQWWLTVVPAAMEATLRLIETSDGDDVHINYSVSEGKGFCCCCTNKFVIDCGTDFLPQEWDGLPPEICAHPVGTRNGNVQYTDSAECDSPCVRFPTNGWVITSDQMSANGSSPCADEACVDLTGSSFLMKVYSCRDFRSNLFPCSSEEFVLDTLDPWSMLINYVHPVTGLLVCAVWFTADQGGSGGTTYIGYSISMDDFECEDENTLTRDTALDVRPGATDGLPCDDIPGTITIAPASGFTDPETGEFIDASGTVCDDDSCGPNDAWVCEGGCDYEVQGDPPLWVYVTDPETECPGADPENPTTSCDCRANILSGGEFLQILDENGEELGQLPAEEWVGEPPQNVTCWLSEGG